MGMAKLRFRVLTMLLLRAYCVLCASASLKDVQSVFEDIIQARTHRHRPVLNQSQPISIRVSLELMSLVDVDEVHQTLSTNVLLTLTWCDEVRTWTPAMYGGLTSVNPDPLDIWRPRLFVSNTVAERDMFKDDYAPLTVFYNGTTVWQPGGILHTSCPMRLARYPFDRHSCRIAFTTGESPEEIQFETDHRNISLEFYEANGEWDLSATSIAVDVIKQSRESVPRLSFNFEIQRKVSFAILCILMPVIVISSLPALVFITPVDSGERVTFSITVFLSLTFSTEQMSGNFPKNSESLPLLVIYLACLLMYSSLAVCVNLVVLLKQNRHEHNASAPRRETDSAKAALEELDTDKIFMSASAMCDLDLPLASIEAYPRYTERSPRYGAYRSQSMTSKRQEECKDSSEQDNFSRRVSLFRKRRNWEENILDPDSTEKSSDCSLPSVVNHMSSSDVVLFVVFSCTWAILAVVFIILQVGDYEKE